MVQHDALHRYPFLRLLVPLAAGIACGDTLYSFGDNDFPKLFFYALPVSFFFLIFAYIYRASYNRRWLFGTSSFIFLFLSGATLITLRLEHTDYQFSANEECYHVHIDNMPDALERSIKSRVTVLSKVDSLQNTHINKKAILYLIADSGTRQLRMGDELLIYAKLRKPSDSGNPEAFDYGAYLLRNDVCATAFVTAGKYKLLQSAPSLDWVQRAQNYRSHVIDYYRRLGFANDDLALLAALTLGDKGHVTDELRETYSMAGASHLLAISGMHIGIVYSLLAFCLLCIPKKSRWLSGIGNLCILLCLWVYVYFIGLAPSAVRAVTMFSLLLIAKTFDREHLTLNTLFVTAFCMLLFRPTWLFDIGFQLSFAAVFSLLTIQPLLFSMCPTRRFGLRHLWGAVTVALAAQIGTAPLVCFYFSRFSTYFLLSGVLLVALTFLIMYSVALMLLLAPLPAVQFWVAGFVKYLLSALNGSATWIEHLPHASWDGLWIYRTELVLFYLLAFFAYCFIKNRSGKALLWTLTLLCSILGYRFIYLTIDRPETHIRLYSQRACPAVHCITEGGRSWMVYGDTVSHHVAIYKTMGRYWSRLRLDPPQNITCDHDDESIQVYDQIVSFAGRRIAIVNDNRWDSLLAETPMMVDYLYLSKGYRGTITSLRRLFNTDQVIFDASIPEYRQERLEIECDTLGISFFSLSREGSMVILPR